MKTAEEALSFLSSCIPSDSYAKIQTNIEIKQIGQSSHMTTETNYFMFVGQNDMDRPGWVLVTVMGSDLERLCREALRKFQTAVKIQQAELRQMASVA